MPRARLGALLLAAVVGGYVVGGSGSASGGVSLALFTDQESDPSTFGTAATFPDTTPPVVSSSLISKTTPYLPGFIRQGGTYYVYAMYRPLGYTSWADSYITNWVGFDPSRFNGFHSYSKDANGNVLPNGAGKTGGCVALAAGDIDAVYDWAYIGMRVVVYR